MKRAIMAINWGCHGIPERCLTFKGKRMGICARCVGCNIGHFFSFLLFVFGILPTFWIGILLTIVMLFDWGLQTYMKIMSNKYRRLVTGFLGGLGIGICIWSVIKCSVFELARWL